MHSHYKIGKRYNDVYKYISSNFSFPLPAITCIPKRSSLIGGRESNLISKYPIPTLTASSLSLLWPSPPMRPPFPRSKRQTQTIFEFATPVRLAIVTEQQHTVSYEIGCIWWSNFKGWVFRCVCRLDWCRSGPWRGRGGIVVLLIKIRRPYTHLVWDCHGNVRDERWRAYRCWGRYR